MLRKTKQNENGEGGNIPDHFPQVPEHQRFVPQPPKRTLVANFGSLLVVLGCFGLFGIVFSTKSAQPFGRRDNPFALHFPGIPGRSSVAGRRSRSGECAPSLDESLPCASYARYSSALQKEESITDQQRRCREAAEREGLAIGAEFEFFDEAVSGTKRERNGLNAMLQAAKEGRFRCLFFYNLSRLARESVISMPMLKELVYVHKIRIVSVTEGIDSDRDGWEMVAAIFSIMAERYIKDLSHSVFRGQEGTVLAGYAVGDHCFGYTSVPLPGQEQLRRNDKPRMTYVIDDKTAPWVVRIFHWFVKERRSIRWITRELNRLGAPKDHRATTKDWRHQYVSRLLENPKYIGDWSWGQRKNTRNPLDGTVRQEERHEEETEKWQRQLPHLRLIDDETWSAAQEILKANKPIQQRCHKSDGRWNGSRAGDSTRHPRHLLQDLMQCKCEAFLGIGGTFGRYLRCPNNAKGTCDCKTYLPRDLAKKLILDAISQRIFFDPAWKELILQEAISAWKKQTQHQPDDLRRIENALAEVERAIQRLVDSIEKNDDPDVDQRLRDRRSERNTLKKELQKAQRIPEKPLEAPTALWVDEQLRALHDLLQEDSPAATWALRKLIGGTGPAGTFHK